MKNKKKEILRLSKNKGACQYEYKKAYKSESTEELLQVVKNNIRWCLKEKMLDEKSLVEIFSEKKLNEQFIFTTGKHSIEVKKDCYIITLGSSSANVKTWDSSSKLTTNVKGNRSYIRNHNKNTIYIKKDNFSIEYVN